MILAAIAAAALFLQMVITMALSRRRRRRSSMPLDEPVEFQDWMISDLKDVALDIVWNGKSPNCMSLNVSKACLQIPCP